MKILKLKSCSAFMGASLFIAPSLFGQIIGTGQLTITAPNYPPDQAGPYLVYNLTPSTGVTPASSFQTFCIGSQVDYSPGSSYGYQISSTVQPSAVGAPGYVTWGTAWLYNQFLNGAWSLGGNLNSVAAPSAESDGLQVAIWDLQNQSLNNITFSSGTSLSAIDSWATYFLESATNAAGSGVNVGGNAAGAFGIYALNMYSDSGVPTDSLNVPYAQPELVRVIPEPGTVFAGILMLVPLGLSILRVVRNRVVCPAHAMATQKSIPSNLRSP